jgi:hypothetical protein
MKYFYVVMLMVFGVGIFLGGWFMFPMECLNPCVECVNDVSVNEAMCPDTGFVKRVSLAEQVGLGIKPDTVAYAVGMR